MGVKDSNGPATALRYQAFDNIDGLGYLPDDLVELGLGRNIEELSLETLPTEIALSVPRTGR
jgi:hypothetical protein